MRLECKCGVGVEVMSVSEPRGKVVHMLGATHGIARSLGWTREGTRWFCSGCTARRRLAREALS